MKNSLHSVAIRRLNKIAFATKSESPKGNKAAVVNGPILGAAVGNLSRLGYWLNTDAIETVKSFSVSELQEVITAARQIKGDVVYTPMYPNFPKQVAKAESWELYVNACIHYLGDAIGVRLVPSFGDKKRKDFTEKVEIVSLGIAKTKDFEDLATLIVKQGQPFSDQDILDLETLREYVTAAEIGIKENIAILVEKFPDLDWSASIKTVTDVLRVATVLSNGDASLSDNTRFKFSRARRRQVVTLLENVLKSNGGNTEDFARHEEKWKRLASVLHAGDFNTPAAIKALDAVYKGEIQSFDSVVEGLLKLKDVEAVVDLLMVRPGTLARRLGELIRKFPDDRKMIVKSFKKVSDKVSIPVLIQMWNFYSGPTADVLSKRAVQYKSRNQRTGVVDNTLVGDYSDVIKAIKSGLKGRNADTKVFVDMDNAKQFAVPLGIRSASTGARAIGRGSRIKVDGDKSTARFFMHWRDIAGGERVDLDLSAFFISENFKKITQVSYTNLRDSSMKTYHSGDLTSAPNGAAEFIDVNIKGALDQGFRYVSMNVYSYTRQDLSRIPEAWAGVMLREKARSGEIFEPSTVAQRYDLTSESKSSTPLIFDLKTREIIWWDSSMKLNDSYNYSIDNNLDPATVSLKSVVLTKVMTVADLVKLTATVVETADEADVVLDPTSTEQVLGLVN